MNSFAEFIGLAVIALGAALLVLIVIWWLLERVMIQAKALVLFTEFLFHRKKFRAWLLKFTDDKALLLQLQRSARIKRGAPLRNWWAQTVLRALWSKEVARLNARCAVLNLKIDDAKREGRLWADMYSANYRELDRAEQLIRELRHRLADASRRAESKIVPKLP